MKDLLRLIQMSNTKMS